MLYDDVEGVSRETGFDKKTGTEYERIEDRKFQEPPKITYVVKKPKFTRSDAKRIEIELYNENVRFWKQFGRKIGEDISENLDNIGVVVLEA